MYTKFYNNNKSIIIATLLFIGFMLFITISIIFGQKKILEYEKRQSQLESEKLAFSLTNTLTISKEYVNILSQSSEIKSYFSNKALGMSLKYGLKANILKMKNEIDSFYSDKKIEGVKIFDYISIVDSRGELVSDINDSPININIEKHLKDENSNPYFVSFIENDFLKLYILKTIYLNDSKVGTLIVKVNLLEILNKFIVDGKNKDLVYINVLGKIFDIKYLMKIDNQDLEQNIVEPIENSELKIQYNFDSSSRFYTSNGFIGLLITISVLIYFIIYYIFKINSRNLLLKTKMDRTKKSNLILEKKVSEKTKELENLNKQLQNKVQSEVKKNKKNQSIIYNQSKMAIMGQMLDNIAHQWRQPLSAISTNASFLKIQKELKILDDKTLLSTMDNIVDSTKFLSETIEDFRSFLKENRKKEVFNIKDTYTKTKRLLISVTKRSEVTLVENIEDIKIYGYSNEIVQVLLNLINNSYDAFLDIEDDRKKYIFVDIYKENDYMIIRIRDNATGISEDIIDKIFEAHFSTKLDTTGTGIGLYMTKEIISNNIKGEISVKNVEFKYKEKDYKGVEFFIKLPCNI